jgi:predicted RND superfamily exporter protein
VKAAKIIPPQATLQIKDFKFGFTPRGDNIVVSFYAKDKTPTPILAEKAKQAADLINSKNLSLVKSASIINPYDTVTNPLTGKSVIAQKSFDRYGERNNNQNSFYDSIVIGIQAQPGADNLKLDKQVTEVISQINNDPRFSNYNAVISASFAPQIKAQINELQRVLLEGLLAVLIVSSILIAIRASFITVISMVTVIVAVNGLLYLIGYTLNTITLFALILSLSLVVDDTIIMTEAIDASRRKENNPREVIKVATGKISKAMIAATLTATLCFAPLAFVGGILGSFVRAIPITIIFSSVNKPAYCPRFHTFLGKISST